MHNYHQKKEFSNRQQYESKLEELPGFIRAFLRSKEQDYQVQTLLAYCQDYIHFLYFLLQTNSVLQNREISGIGEIDLDVFRQLTSEDLEEYRVYLTSYSIMNEDGEIQNFTNSETYIKRKMASLNGLFRYLYLKKRISENPMERIERPKNRNDHSARYLEIEDVKLLMDSVAAGSAEYASDRQLKYLLKTKERDLAIFTLLLHTGLRVSECVGLDLDDISFDRREIQIQNPDGSRDLLYMNETTLSALQNYVYGARKAILPAEGHEKALFLSSMKGKRLCVKAVENMVKKYGQYTGMPIKITPHSMRKTYGTQLYERTGDLKAVQQQLRHKCIDTTSRFYVGDSAQRKRQIAEIDLYGDEE